MLVAQDIIGVIPHALSAGLDAKYASLPLNAQLASTSTTFMDLNALLPLIQTVEPPSKWEFVRPSSTLTPMMPQLKLATLPQRFLSANHALQPLSVPLVQMYDCSAMTSELFG
jgi:hypothetical protein